MIFTGFFFQILTLIKVNHSSRSISIGIIYTHFSMLSWLRDSEVYTFLYFTQTTKLNRCLVTKLNRWEKVYWYLNYDSVTKVPYRYPHFTTGITNIIIPSKNIQIICLFKGFWKIRNESYSSNQSLIMFLFY